MALYHKDIGFPKNLSFPTGTHPLAYSDHALHASRNDRYGRFPLPTSIDTSKAPVIEAEVRDGRLVKLVYQIRIDSRRNMFVPVIAHRGGLLAKTVWINLVTDTHKTLNRARYDIP